MVGENNSIENLEFVLKKLLRNNPNIIIAIITSMEGLPILSILPRKYDEIRFSAMVAALLSLSERTVIDMDIGEFKQLYIKGNDGYLLVFEAEPAVLAVSTSKKAKLGLIFLECERTSHDISKILKKRE